MYIHMCVHVCLYIYIYIYIYDTHIDNMIMITRTLPVIWECGARLLAAVEPLRPTIRAM